jgi:hypothetical protein
MPRKRTISPEFFTDEDIGDLHPLDRLLFIGLWCQADKAGRLKDKPRTIKQVCLPYDKHDVEQALKRLSDGGFIYRYVVDGIDVIQIRTWDKNQNTHHTEQSSKLPELPDALSIFTPLNNGSTTVKTPLNNGEDSSQNPEPRTQKKTVELPEVLSASPLFMEWWGKWNEHRKEIGKPLKPTQEATQVTQFVEWGIERSVDAMRYTISKGWQGLREEESENGKPKHQASIYKNMEPA